MVRGTCPQVRAAATSEGIDPLTDIITEERRRCTQCGERPRSGKTSAWCTRCSAPQRAAWAKRNPDKVRRISRGTTLRKHGLTLDQYDDMMADQNGQCLVCGRWPEGRLHVDHDHVTGRVRGLLCAECNKGLGQFGDDVARLRSAIRYLEGRW